MPTDREIVANRPLAGHELIHVIQRDLADLLARDGILNSHMAFGRCSYEVTVKVYLDNPSFPEHDLTLRSQRPTSDVLEGRVRNEQGEKLPARPELAAIEPPPLKDTSLDLIARGQVRARKIVSPNKLRVEQGLPLTVNVRNQEGHVEEHQVTYAPEEAGMEGADPLADTETRELSAEELGVAATEPQIAPVPENPADATYIPTQPASNFADPVAAEAALQRQVLDAAVEGQASLGNGIPVPNENKEAENG